MPPLPMLASPATRTGPVKTGGWCLYWTTNAEPIDKHRVKKDILSSMQQWSTKIQTACSNQPQNCTFHSMSSTWPNC